jgi:hypothetical protein
VDPNRVDPQTEFRFFDIKTCKFSEIFTQKVVQSFIAICIR